MRLFSCPLCESETDDGKKKQDKKTVRDVWGLEETRPNESDCCVPDRGRRHIPHQHRRKKGRDRLADVFSAIRTVIRRRRQNAVKTAARHSKRPPSRLRAGKSWPSARHNYSRLGTPSSGRTTNSAKQEGDWNLSQMDIAMCNFVEIN